MYTDDYSRHLDGNDDADDNDDHDHALGNDDEVAAGDEMMMVMMTMMMMMLMMMMMMLLVMVLMALSCSYSSLLSLFSFRWFFSHIHREMFVTTVHRCCGNKHAKKL